ncbi:MAG: DUF3048 domain-containing protein [Actinobacteria bacterium]|nr:DUF3048 domain-containing protein [Actinomycetota bacterium]
MTRRLMILLVTFVVFAAACGGGDDDAAIDTEELAGDDVDDAPESAATDAETTTSTAVTVPVGPPTTRGPAPAVVVEPLAGVGSITVFSGEPVYRGVLGQIDPDRNIVTPAALPPDTPKPGISPLTGLPIDPLIASRPAMVVKIDNTEKGRPQEALALADVIFVEQIEGGFTRLVVVFHSNTPAEIGPIRSGRSSDISILGSFNNPIFVWSGANRVQGEIIRRQNFVDLGARSRSEYYRADDRPGTYDLMADPAVLWGIAEANEDGDTPVAQFEFQNDEVGLPDGAIPVDHADVSYPSVTSSWTWDGAAGGWRREQSGTEHVDAMGNPVIAANVLVAEVEQVWTGSVDAIGTRVYEEQFLGSGVGYAFISGHMIEVTWTKPSIHSVATWTTADGVPVALSPGQTWIELAPIGSLTAG